MKVLLLKGLPASGKSTYARELLKEPNWKRVNKDDLRKMIDDGKWSKTNEQFTLNIRDYIVTVALLQGCNVVVDDTNLASSHETRLRELVEIYNGALLDGDKVNPKEKAEFEIKDFTDVPLEECIKRDQNRPNYVGEKVIRRMYNQYLRPKITKPTMPESPKAIVCDLDGSLALFGDKNPYDRDFENDEINPAVRYVLDGNDQFNQIVFVSGRSDKFRTITQEWLDKYGFGGHPLFMRKEGDNRPDTVIKQEIYDQHLKGKYNILFVIDDRPQVCRLWYSLGLPLFKVGDPDLEF